MLPRKSANEDAILEDQLADLLRHRDGCKESVFCPDCSRLEAVRLFLLAPFRERVKLEGNRSNT